MKIIKWMLLIVLVGGYPACYWDYHLSNYLFDKYCNEEGHVGQFVYERVGIDESYFVPIPKDPTKIDQHLVVSTDLMIDRSALEQRYLISRYKKVTKKVSSIGPIYTLETSVIRKSDQKLIGTSVSLVNRLGWWNLRSILGQSSRRFCPSGVNNKTGLSKDSELHATLFTNIFFRESKGGSK